jgi:hypothetical protein
MTCLELLAASAISSMLMVSLLTVMGAVSAEQRRPQARSLLDAPVQFEDLLRSDLTQARFLRYSHDRLSLRSYSGLNWQTLSPTHRPVEITYEVVEIAGEPWLVRRQLDLDSLSSDAQRTVPVFAGVSGFHVRLLEALPADTATQSPTDPPPPQWRWRDLGGDNRWEPAPRGVEVVFDASASDLAQPRRVLALR